MDPRVPRRDRVPRDARPDGGSSDVGSWIALIIFGAIFAFAVRAEFRYIDIQTVGWILMIAGIIGLVLSSINRRRRAGESADPYDV